MKQHTELQQSRSHAAQIMHRVGVRLLESRRRAATVGAVALACLLAYHVVAGNNGVNVYKRKMADDKALTAEVKQLQQENDRLRKHVDHLATDPGAIEHEAQVRLHYTRPGQVILLNDAADARTRSTESPKNK